MTIIPEGYAQITHLLAGTASPNGAAVTYGISNGDDTPPDVLGAAYHTLFGDDIVNGLGLDTHLVSTICKLGPNETGAQWEGGADISGSDVNAQVAPQVSMLIRKNTNLGGRRGRGRIFLPGCNETELNQDGSWETVYLGQFQGFWDSFYEDGTAGSHDFVVLHSPHMTWELVDGQPRRVPDLSEPVPAPTIITGFTVASQSATQRRRNRR